MKITRWNLYTSMSPKECPAPTPLWISEKGGCIIANNNSRIPDRVLSVIVEVIEARSREIIDKWADTFGKISFYC